MYTFVFRFLAGAVVAVASFGALADTPKQAASKFVDHPGRCSHLLGQPERDDALTNDYGQATVYVVLDILEAAPQFSIADSVDFLRNECSVKLGKVKKE
jgi:hypothetical protein